MLRFKGYKPKTNFVKVVANRNNTASTHVFFSFSGHQSQVNNSFSLLTLGVRITYYLAKERKALKKLLCDELIRNKQPIYMNEMLLNPVQIRPEYMKEGGKVC